MAIGPCDKVLEIGCGHGIAVSLICDRLTTGQVTAIDRSASMVRLASQRNAGHIAAGRAEFVAADLDEADLPAGGFDKVFAVNVSLFWLGTGPGQIERVKRLLARQGTLYVFHEPPKPSIAKTILDKAEATLREHGFTTARHRATGRRGQPLTCVSGTVALPS
jgi:ubiquinone/menaquinone biosynthesis C-methylase UbiE